MDSPVIIENVRNKGFLTFEKINIISKPKGNLSLMLDLQLDKSPIRSDETYKIPVKTESTSS